MSQEKLFFTHKPLATQNNCVSAESYQNLIRSGGQSPKSLVNTVFFGFSNLFPFYCCWRFGGYVVDDAVYALDLVDDAHGDFIEHLVRDARPVGGHEVRCGDASEGESIVIRSAVAHDTDGAHIGQHREVLVHRALKMRLCDLLAEDEVGVAEDIQLLLCDIAYHADGKTRAREGLPHHKVIGQTQLPAECAHLVLEQQAQRLYDLLEVHAVGQAADVMVALDDGGDVGAGFDDVGIDGALNKIVHRAYLPALVLEHADELLADDLALGLRIGHAGKLCEEALLGVDAHEIDVPVLEGRLDLVALILAHEAVVDENAGELTADGLGKQGRRDGGIDAAGQREQHLAAADLGAYRLYRRAHIVAHRPVAGRAADLVQEVAQHRLTVLGMVYLGVELHAVKAAALIADADGGAGGAVRHEAEAFGHLCHIIAVAHPCHALLGDALKQAAAGIEPGRCFTVFAGGIALRGGDLAAQIVRHELAAVADAKDGNAQAEDPGVDLRRALGVDALGAAGEDDADGSVGPDLLKAHAVGLYLAVDIALADSSCDELIVLTAEVEHQYTLVLHS